MSVCWIGIGANAGNARVAFDTLADLKVPIVSESVGSNKGMRLYFDNWSGLVLVRPHRDGRKI